MYCRRYDERKHGLDIIKDKIVTVIDIVIDVVMLAKYLGLCLAVIIVQFLKKGKNRLEDNKIEDKIVTVIGIVISGVIGAVILAKYLGLRLAVIIVQFLKKEKKRLKDNKIEDKIVTVIGTIIGVIISAVFFILYLAVIIVRLKIRKWIFGVSGITSGVIKIIIPIVSKPIKKIFQNSFGYRILRKIKFRNQ